jgi:hypothetical protein
MQVTPGFGTSVATELKGNAHHQRVITHDDIVTSSVTPPVAASEYAVGQVIGSEMSFAAATRFAGDTSRLEAVKVTAAGETQVADMDLVLYTDALNSAPTNGQEMAVQASELRSILAVIAIPASAYKSVGGHKVALVQPDVPTVLRSSTGSSAVRGALVARGTVKPELSDSLDVTIVVRRS